MSEKKGDLIKLGGLWFGRNPDAKGNKYLNGKFGYSAKILIFKNSFKKEGSNEPDYNMFLAPAGDGQQDGSGSSDLDGGSERKDLDADKIDPDGSDVPF